MTGTGALLDLADFTCSRCGRLGVDTFTDLAGLEAVLSPRALRPGGGAQRMPRFGIGQVTAADLERFGPCHRTCPSERPPAEPCPYDLVRSVC